MTVRIMRYFALVIIVMGVLATGSMTALAQNNDTTISIDPVSYQLNALDSENMMNFYTNVMGMTVLDSDDAGYYALGNSDGELLLELFPTDIPRNQDLTTGLYHTAYLFEDREYMASLLEHMFAVGAPLEGLTHHIVSDAVYLADAEGNGIEIYWDYPESEWEYNEDGSIIMGNEALDPEELMATADEEFTELDGRASVGHFHLVVNDLEDTGNFYSSILGLQQHSHVEGDSTFYASGDYHHHLAGNVWFGNDSPMPEEGAQGLRAMVWAVETPEDLSGIADALNANSVEFEESENELSFLDNSGLGVVVRVQSE